MQNSVHLRGELAKPLSKLLPWIVTECRVHRVKFSEFRTILRWCPSQEFMILDMMTNNNSKILENEHIILGCGY